MKFEYSLNNSNEEEIDEDYIDEVGGFHSPCNCVNPKGYFCGDCTKLSCKDCVYNELEGEK